MSARALALALIACGCSRESGSPPSPPSSAPRTASLDASAAASASPSAQSSSSARPRTSVPDPIRDALRSAPIRSLATRSVGAFDVTLELAGSPSARMTVALDETPVAYRRAIAWDLLTRELGARVAPVAALRSMPAGELARLAPDAVPWLRQRAHVLADGTVDVVLRTPGPPASPWTASETRSVALDGREADAWGRAAATPLEGSSTDATASAYVEMLVIDYLAADVARQRVLVVSAGGLFVEDDGQSFPLRPNAPALERLLRKLKPIRRFPRAVRDGLARLDAARASALWTFGAFEDWLLSPRALVELGERRATLLSLVEARVAEQGESATLAP